MTFEAAWARSRGWLASALAHAGDTHELDDVLAMITDGSAQLWAAPKAAAVTLIEDDPCERRLLVWLAGGDLKTLLSEMLPEAEAWARARGCRRMLVVGRPGWERAMTPMGYAPLARVIAKDL